MGRKVGKKREIKKLKEGDKREKKGRCRDEGGREI